LNPNVAKAGGLQSQGAKGAAVVDLLQALGNVGSGVLRLSRRVKKMAYNRPNPQVHHRFIPRKTLQCGVVSILIRFYQLLAIFFMQPWGELT
jgi:hypothetical protein